MRSYALAMIGLAAAGSIALVLAGCGGGSGAHYTASTTVNCLDRLPEVRDLNTSQDDLDVFASDALEGGLEAEFESGNSITIAFERTASDAKRSADGQKLFAAAFGSEIDELVGSESNVALAWDKVPSDEESEAVKSCLSEGGGPIPLVEQDSSSSESHEYTSASYAAHYSSCVGRGFSDTKCRCFMDWAQERYYSFQLEEDVLPNKADLVEEVLDQCPN